MRRKGRQAHAAGTGADTARRQDAHRTPTGRRQDADTDADRMRGRTAGNTEVGSRKLWSGMTTANALKIKQKRTAMVTDSGLTVPNARKT